MKMVDGSSEMVPEDRRKHLKLRKNVDALLQQLRDAHDQLGGMNKEELAEVENRFLSQAHIIWDNLLDTHGLSKEED